MTERVIGWDLGGAHVKSALAEDGRITAALQVYSPLWDGLAYLNTAIDESLRAHGPAAKHAITMTGEVADIFPTREAGVTALVAAAEAKFGTANIAVFAGTRGFVTAREAMTHWRDVASANWLASASLVAAHQPEALVVDIGSTTTDIVPVVGGKVRSAGTSDSERLALGELVYSGILRTPVMAVASEIEFEGEQQGVMAEQFATMADAYRVAGMLPDGLDETPAADGGGKNMIDSARRLARMLGRDAAEYDFTAWRRFADQLIAVQSERIEKACRRVADRAELDEVTCVVSAGCGDFLARTIAACLNRPHTAFSAFLNVADSARQAAGFCAPAVAVALLARP